MSETQLELDVKRMTVLNSAAGCPKLCNNGGNIVFNGSSTSL